MRLCEQLRLVLEPTLATRLQGDYRTGKRINMRRVVGYVASGFRKDKIWLRRTKPAKRDYQVIMMMMMVMFDSAFYNKETLNSIFLSINENDLIMKNKTLMKILDSR